MLAVKHGKAELVEILVENGAAVNLQDADGSTALMCAVEHESLNIVKLLLAKSECDVNIADNVNRFLF
jgi:ankyrin repeat protein